MSGPHKGGRMKYDESPVCKLIVTMTIAGNFEVVSSCSSALISVSIRNG